MRNSYARIVLGVTFLVLSLAMCGTANADLLNDLADQLIKKAIEEVQGDDNNDNAEQEHPPGEGNDETPNLSGSHTNGDVAGATAGSQRRSIPLPEGARPITLDYLDGAIALAPNEASAVLLPKKFEMKVGEISPGAFGSFPQASFSRLAR